MLTKEAKDSYRMTSRPFTLIELLTVIAVIAILMALLLPALSRAKYMAKTAHCVSNQKQVGVSLVMYCGDYDTFYPYFVDNSGNGEREGGGTAVAAGQDMQAWRVWEPYFSSREGMKGILTCPHIANACDAKWSTNTFPYPAANGLKLSTYQLYYNARYNNRIAHDGRKMMKLGRRWRYGSAGGLVTNKYFDIVAGDPLISRIYGVGGINNTWGNLVTHVPWGAPLVDENLAGHHVMGLRVAYWSKYNANYLFTDGSVQHYSSLKPTDTLGGTWMWKVPVEAAQDD